MLWSRGEADILEEVVRDAATKVDTLFCAAGDAADWDILQRLQREGVVEHIQREDETFDRAQRNSLLAKIRERYNPVDTLVQVIESDVFLLETDVRAAWREHAVDDVGMGWIMLNAVRHPGTWKGADAYPDWPAPIREVMPFAHEMERVTYTFRPLPGIEFDHWTWRPWPRGFSRYTQEPLDRPKGDMAPLLLHVGYRGPMHFHLKYRHMGKRHTKYRTWWVNSPENVERTVAYFNGGWNGDAFPATREGWRNRKREATTSRR